MLDEAMGVADRVGSSSGTPPSSSASTTQSPTVLFHTRQCVAASPSVVDLVTWSTPEGVPGMQLMDGSHPLWQVWLNR